MADWYVSSAAYATYTAFQTSHAYSIGDIIVPTAPTAKNKIVLRCTTAGSSAGSEPSWSNNNNATTTSNTAVFTNVTGQSAYGWTAAAGDLLTLNGSGTGTNRYSAGDRTFVSSDHSESQSSGSYGSGSSISGGYGLLQFICVNRAGSTPPVAADVTTGATITGTSGLIIYCRVNAYMYGFSFVQTGAGSAINFNDNSLQFQKSLYFQSCTFYQNNNNASSSYAGFNCKVILDNTTLQFGNTGQTISSTNNEFVWVNTPSAIPGATLPTVLFTEGAGSNVINTVTARGVDLSAITGTLVKSNGGPASRYLFDSCKIASASTRYSNAASANTTDIIELVNCFDGTNQISESYQVPGTITTERTITLSGGAADNVGGFSHKLVSGSNVDKFVNTLNSFWMDLNYTTTGSSKTATVEIISSGTLNNDEISLYLEYEGTSSSSVASFGTSFIATPLTTPSAVTSSSATWNSSPSTPQKQKLQVTFTPQTAGRVRGQVRLGKSSGTVYVNPQITIT